MAVEHPQPVMDEPEACSECGSGEPMVFMAVHVAGYGERHGWVCDACGHAHLDAGQPVTPEYEREWLVDGISMVARISPCSWMYETYGVQVHVSEAGHGSNGASIFEVLKVPFAKATVGEVDAFVAGIQVCWSACSTPGCTGRRLVGSRKKSDGGEVCEPCFLRQLHKEFEAAAAKEKAREAREDVKKAGEGFTHKVEAWIHPKAGGDDRQVVVYWRGKPTDDDVKKLLRRQSRVDSDFRVVALPAVPDGVREAADKAWLAKACVGKTLFREKGKYADIRDGWRSYKKPASEETRAWVVQKHGDVEFAVDLVPQSKGAKQLATLDLKAGDFVEWSGSGAAVRGWVVKVNRKTIQLRDQDGEVLNCGLGGDLKRVEAPAGRLPSGLEAAGWLHPKQGQRLGVPADRPVGEVAWEDAGGFGALFAVLGRRLVPLVLDGKGRAVSFSEEEARKVARCLGAQIRRA